MIRVCKRAEAPTSLKKGLALSARDKASYDAEDEGYRSGQRKFTFQASVYSAPKVKAMVVEDQMGKCCFCEGIFDAHVSGDVEHYRPKGGIDTGAGRIYPGYYWLAYEWSNLYYACPDCNAYRKKAKFPLRDEATRARSHHQTIADERPLILDPGANDPRLHIRFENDWPVGLTREGSETIRALKLDRPALNMKRGKYLRLLAVLRDRVAEMRADANVGEGLADLEALLSEKLSVAGEFSSAAQDFVAGWRRPAELIEV